MDRYGNVYLGGQGGIASSSSKSARVGWLIQEDVPSEAQLRTYLTGFGKTCCAGYYLGVAGTWSQVDSGTQYSTEIGVATPGVSCQDFGAVQVYDG